MQRYVPAARHVFLRKLINPQTQTHYQISKRHQTYDVFINHRGIDTRRTIGGLLYDHLLRLGYNPFLDRKNMKPGDQLFENINTAIRNSRVGIAVLSPRYCESYFCLHELALIMELRKKVIPIFYDVKPSQLRVLNNGTDTQRELQRFNWALDEAKYTVGVTFDSSQGDWSEFLTIATDAIIKNLVEDEEEHTTMQ